MEGKTLCAAVGILVNGDKTLLLHRKNTPLCWCPPGGRVETGESYEDAAKREVYEETGIACRPLIPVEEWDGIHEGSPMHSVTYVCECGSEDVALSDEHDDFCWVAIKDIEQWKDKTDFDVSRWGGYIDRAKKQKNTETRDG